MVHLRCIAFLSTIWCACGFEDVAALIQHKQSIGALDDTGAVDERAQALPNPGSSGIRMSRLSANAEAGSSIVVNYSKTCEEYDAFGPKECTLYFGTPVLKTVKIHLAGGLQSGDVFHMSWDVHQTHNSSHWASFLVPANSHMLSNCGFCENDCTFELTNSKIDMTASLPTFLDNFDFCNGTIDLPEEEFTLTDKTDNFPKPFEGLAIEGNITAGLGVLREDGSIRAQGSWIYRIQQGPAATSLAERAKGGALLEQRVIGPMGLLQEVLVPEMLLSPATELAETLGLRELPISAATSLRSVDHRRVASHALELNVTVRSLPVNGSFSLLSVQCNTTDSLGSASCRFPFNSVAELAPAMDIAFDAVEGSTLYVSSKFTPGGSFGMLFAHKFKKKEMNVPLCGTDPVTVLDVNNVPHKYKPWKCGSYSLSLASLEPFSQALNDFDDFKLPPAPFMPFLPRTFNEVLPLRLAMEMEMKDTANNTIASFALSTGLFLV